MKTKRKKYDTRRVNQKYVKLLSTTYDKYIDLAILKLRDKINSDQEEKEETTVKVINAPKIVQSKSSPILN